MAYRMWERKNLKKKWKLFHSPSAHFFVYILWHNDSVYFVFICLCLIMAWNFFLYLKSCKKIIYIVLSSAALLIFYEDNFFLENCIEQFFLGYKKFLKFLEYLMIKFSNFIKLYAYFYIFINKLNIN